MSWTAETIETQADGEVLDVSEFLDLDGDFSLEHTLGDEQYVKGGDLRISHVNVLPSGANKYWLALYWDSTLVDVFEIKKPYCDIDFKTGRMTSRLQSITLSVFDQLSEIVVAPLWGSVITRIYLDTTTYYDDRYGWNVDILIELITNTVMNGFIFNDVTTPGPGAMAADSPIIYRGSSNTVLADAITKTFTTPETKWDEILRIGCLLWNAFVRIRPEIITTGSPPVDYLGINMNLLPRTNLTASGSTPVLWNELTKEFRAKRVDGVHITGPMIKRIYSNNVPDIELAVGNIYGGKIHKKSINLAEFPAWQAGLTSDGRESQLWICKGDYNSGTGKFDCDDGALGMAPWFFNGLSTAYYTGMIGNYHDYKGKARYNGERAGDDVIAEGTTHMLISRVSVDRAGVASIEGFSIQ